MFTNWRINYTTLHAATHRSTVVLTTSYQSTIINKTGCEMSFKTLNVILQSCFSRLKSVTLQFF